jgi:hypothetical protein
MEYGVNLCLTEKEKVMPRTIAVDFDAVIHTYDKGWQDGSIYGELMEGAVEGLADWMNQFAVYVHTSRAPRQVSRWIESKTGIRCTTKIPRSGFWQKQGLLLITQQKLPAFAYVDDRGIHFKTWSQARTALALMVRQEDAKLREVRKEYMPKPRKEKP